MASYYEKLKKHREAEEYFGDFLKNYSSSAKNPERLAQALLKMIKLARAQYQGIERGMECIERAESYSSELIEEFPELAAENKIDEASLTELREIQAASKLNTAQWYSKQGDWVSARYVLKRLCSETRLAATPSAEKARSWLIERFQ